MASEGVSLFESSVSTVDENMSINDVGLNTEDENIILERLNQLREWQAAQQKALVESQLDQQKMLQLEKNKLYELFGLSAEASLRDDNDGSTDSSFAYQNVQNAHDIAETPKRNEEQTERLICGAPIELNSPSMNQLQKIIENMAIRSPNRDTNNPEDLLAANIPKRPYLKRGEGLKTRFKIAPDAFRLDKLPKYKYAQRVQKHAQSTHARKQRHQEITAIKSSADAGVRASSEGQQNKARDAICMQSANQTENIAQVKQSTKRPSPKTQQLKLKTNKSPSANQSKPNFIQGNKSNFVPTRLKSLSPASKRLLDTPTREKVQLQQNEIDELKSFVRLEEDFDKNSSATMDRARSDEKFMQKLKMNSSPKHLIANRSIEDIEEEEEEEEHRYRHNYDSDDSAGDDGKRVHFQRNAIAIAQVYHNQEADDMSAMSLYDTLPSTSSPMEKSTESFMKFKEKLFDRRLKQKFQNRLSVAKDFELSDLNSNKSGCSESNASPGQSLIFGGKGEGNELIRDRLLTLEQEIQSFREQNNELTKLIREHELIRLSFDEERRTALDRMENERINFELYMHDKRLKMLDEKAKWEKKTKEPRGITQTEKDELARLREKCATHEAELSAREQKHVAAQARVRAQLRNVEKDLKELRLEAENLQRENKKLDAENMRMRRQSNTKILSEINRSISKLSHSTECENEKDAEKEKTRHGVKKCSNKNAHKTVVAKVVSQHESLSSQLRSKSVPNLTHSESSDKVTYELCSSNASEGENSETSSQDGNRSSYFQKRPSLKERFAPAQECDKGDEADRLSTSLKRVIENPDGSKDVWYPNGNLKKVSANGMFIRMLYYNKDIKETDIKEGTIKYYYADSNTWQTTFLDGLEIFEYSGGQTEHRYKDGRVEVYFPNGSVRLTNPAREQSEGIKEEWKYSDGTNAVQLTNGERILVLPNGQREIHANGHKRRVYPDGTVKIVYPDGSQETRYANGRVRLKNKDGKLIMDSETISI